MNKILCNFVFVFVLCLNEASCVDQSNSPNLFNLFNEFASQSWKMKPITIGGMRKTVEQHIIDEFNAEEWEAGSKDEKINRNINTAIKSYYEGKLNDPNGEGHYDPCNPTGWKNDLATDDSPRQWMDKLTLRELYRFKECIASHKIFDNANYEKNDLVKAKALCGIFWVVYTGDTYAEQSFSGMLAPNQEFVGCKSSPYYQIYTCMHGFSDGNKNNNIAYYFVPYGVIADGDPQNDGYVVKKGFKVIKIKQGGTETVIDIDNEKFAKNSSFISDDVLYSQNDYAVAFIDKCTLNGIGMTLKDIMIATNLGIVKDKDIKLPNFTDNIISVSGNKRLFSIGLAACPFIALENEFVISTTFSNNDILTTRLRRSIRNDQNTKTPQNICERNNEYFSSLVTFSGMSGGPVFECRLTDDGQIRICKIVGTVWGKERVFKKNLLVGFRNIINKNDIS